MISNMNSIKRAAVLAFALFTIAAMAVSADTETMTTARTPSNSVIAPNTNMTDTASVTKPNGINDVTGTVQFYICHKNTATANDYPVCTTPADGSIFGGPIALSVGPIKTATSAVFSTPSSGTYCFLAVYSGDSNYSPLTDSINAGNQSAECFFVSSSTAVTLSSMSAQLMEEGGNWVMWDLGALSMATLGAVVFVFARKR